MILGKPALLSGPPFACVQNDSGSLQLQDSLRGRSLTVTKDLFYREKSYSPHGNGLLDTLACEFHKRET